MLSFLLFFQNVKVKRKQNPVALYRRGSRYGHFPVTLIEQCLSFHLRLAKQRDYSHHTSIR
jgi:hypothetical protein